METTTSNFQIINYDAEYASQVMTNLPYGYIDKSIPGCGLTTVALEGNRNTIIAVPNNSLINNKVAQYPNDRCNFEILGVQEGVNQEDISDYLMRCESNNQPVKIMITYDSLLKVKDLLKDESYDLVIDESHKLLKYAKVKVKDKDLKRKDVLTTLLEIAYEVKERVSFISATPIPLEYMPEWIGKELDLIKMNWSNTIKAAPLRMQRDYPFQALKNEIIRSIIDSGYFKIKDTKYKKVIVFLNSVSEITKALDGLEYDKEDIAYIAGSSSQSSIKLKDLNKLETPDNLPKITFITSAGYDGIDLYDEEAISVVVSSTSKDFTMTDIATDLQQAISRQRIKTNEHYGKYIFIYNQTIFDKTEEELLKNINELKEDIESSIYLYNKNANSDDDKAKRGVSFLTKESRDFSAYTIYNEELNEFRTNEQVFNSDKYFVLKVRKQYEEGFNIRAALGELGELVNETIISERLTKSYKDYAAYYNKNKNWNEEFTNKDWKEIVEISVRLFKKAKLNYTNAKEDIANYVNPSDGIKSQIVRKFNVGTSYNRAEVKSILQTIYDQNNIKRKAKHSDLNEFFEVKERKSNGERYCEILKRK